MKLTVAFYIEDSSHNIISYCKDNAGIFNYDKQVYLPHNLVSNW